MLKLFKRRKSKSWLKPSKPKPSKLKSIGKKKKTYNTKAKKKGAIVVAMGFKNF